MKHKYIISCKWHDGRIVRMYSDDYGEAVQVALRSISGDWATRVRIFCKSRKLYEVAR